MTTTRRVVIDTSSLVGALLRPKSVPREALMLVLGSYELCVSTATLSELKTVLQRAKFDRYSPPAARQEFLALIIAHARHAAVSAMSEKSAHGVCRDPKDAPFLALTLSCQAAALISIDADLLTLHPWRGVKIVTPATFLDLARPR